jgi:hypothetical protein
MGSSEPISIDPSLHIPLQQTTGSWLNKGGARSGATAEQLINEPQQQQWYADGDYFEKE